MGDIVTLSDLEQQATIAIPEVHFREISLITDICIRLGTEYSTFDLSPGREKFAGACAFYTSADAPKFFAGAGFGGTDHGDGIYGWSQPLDSPELRGTPLACPHVRIFTHKESVL